jgi:hypothetical protein
MDTFRTVAMDEPTQVWQRLALSMFVVLTAVEQQRQIYHDRVYATTELLVKRYKRRHSRSRSATPPRSRGSSRARQLPELAGGGPPQLVRVPDLQEPVITVGVMATALVSALFL